MQTHAPLPMVFMQRFYKRKLKEMIMQTKLKEFALELGADLVGFCKLPAPPVKELPNNTYAVSIAVKLSKGIMTDKAARKQNIGGEVLAFVW